MELLAYIAPHLIFPMNLAKEPNEMQSHSQYLLVPLW